MKDIGEDKNSKLDPSFYLHHSNQTEDNIRTMSSVSPNFSSKTMLRRRNPLKAGNIKEGDKISNFSTFSSPVHLPVDEAPGRIIKENHLDKCPSEFTGDSIETLEGKQPKEMSKDKIFSITTSIVLVIFVISLAAICSLCTMSSNTLLVNAHFSDYSEVPQNRLAKSTQRPNGAMTNKLDSPVSSSTERNKISHSSIDRFDDGEQIRPPIVHQPTTLAPQVTTTRQANQQRQLSPIIDSDLNLQTAATQDTYLSPEDHNQLMRSQENHYEGRNSPIDGQPSMGAMQAHPSSNEARESQSSWNGVDPRAQSRLTGSESNNNLRGSQIASSDPAGDAEDGDYDDEQQIAGPNQDSANLVPETRRGLGQAASTAASYNQQRQQRNPMMDSNNNNDEGDQNDDYSNANDDAYFSRKSPQNNNNLNPSASFNQQQNRNYNPISGGVHQQAYDNGPSERSQESNNQIGDEASGFGPGPNEAYLADRAEMSGKMANDPDDDQAYNGINSDPSDSSSLTGDDTDKLSRRSSQDNSKLAANSAHLIPMNYRGDNSQNDESGDADSDSDSEEPSGSSEESAPVSKASSPMDNANIGPNSNGQFQQHQQPLQRDISGNMMPRTSASAPAPQSAPRPSAMLSILSQSVAPIDYRARANPHLTTTTRRPESASDKKLMGSRYGEANKATITGQTVGPQYRATPEPYNPQNNPSHAGKYFIN